MSLILCIDSAGHYGSIALFDDGQLVAEHISTEERSHSRRLAPDIKTMMDESGRGLEELEAVAVAAGPGSYTGLRIGVSMAKGLCLSLDIPLLSMNSLEILARRTDNPEDKYICPVMDARRMEIYTAIYSPGFELIEAPHPHILTGESFAEHLEKYPILFAGDGAEKVSTVVDHLGASFDPNAYSSADAMGTVMHEKLRSELFEDLDNFEPEYLKPVHTTTPKKLF